MAKFTRYDPRNKKKHRNKIQSLNKDPRIKEEKSYRRKTSLKDFELTEEDTDDFLEYERYLK